MTRADHSSTLPTPSVAETLPAVPPSLPGEVARSQSRAGPGELDHHQRLQRIIAQRQGRHDRRPLRRGWPAQRSERELEQMVRRQCVQFRSVAADYGLSRAEAADYLGVLPRTLLYWEQRSREDGLQPVPRGRPVARSPHSQRNEVLAAIRDVGTGIGVPTLRTHFPHMTRVELADLLARSRRVYRRRYRQTQRVLHWLRPGSVWAIDFSEAECLIDGEYPYLLAVRDLASHYTLAWLPVTEMTAEVTMAALTKLFATWGAPLLLKADNGSPFHAEATTAFLAAMQVQILFSPAYTPRYNGAIEAGIGAL